MATRNPTLTPEALKEIIDQAVKEALAAREIQEKDKSQDDHRKKIVSAFVKAGFKNAVPFDPSRPLSAQPDVNVLTYSKFALDLGRKVKTRQKALRIKGHHHIEQTEVMTPAERKEYFAKQQAKAAKREAKRGSASLCCCLIPWMTSAMTSPSSKGLRGKSKAFAKCTFGLDAQPHGWRCS